MGKPGANSKVSERTAEEGFEHDGGVPFISPLTYQGRGGGNPDSPHTIGIAPHEDGDEPIVPRDPAGYLSTIPGGATGRGKRGGGAA